MSLHYYPVIIKVYMFIKMPAAPAMTTFWVISLIATIDHFRWLAIKWSQAFLTWDCVNSFSHFEQKTTFAAFTNSWLEIWLWSLLTASSSVFLSLSTIRLTASSLSTIDTQTWLTLSFQPAARRTEASMMTTFTPSFQYCWIWASANFHISGHTIPFSLFKLSLLPEPKTSLPSSARLMLPSSGSNRWGH